MGDSVPYFRPNCDKTKQVSIIEGIPPTACRLPNEAVAKLLLAFATGSLGVLEIWRKLLKISETPRLLFSQQRK
jgi:hypothetical protein